MPQRSHKHPPLLSTLYTHPDTLFKQGQSAAPEISLKETHSKQSLPSQARKPDLNYLAPLCFEEQWDHFPDQSLPMRIFLLLELAGIY